MALNEYLATEIALEHAEGLLTRREALHKLALLGVGVVAASTMLGTSGARGAAKKKPTATTTSAKKPATSKAATTTTTAATTTSVPRTGVAPITFAGQAGDLFGSYAAPPGRPKGAVLIIHENRGLTDHFRALPGRFASDGFAALAIDLASRVGGTDKVASQMPAPLAQASTEDLVADMRAGLDELGRRAPGARLGTIGFCFGGGMVWNLVNSGDTRLAAAAPFYGVGPANPNFGTSKAAVLAVYAELDARVNANRDAMTAAMKQAGLAYEVKTFPGVDHAFFNETGPRYNPQQAKAAYQAVLGWFMKYLAGSS